DHGIEQGAIMADLDTETLELLEELLLNFEGTLLLVSHDRALLDAVVTSTLVFEGDGRLSEYVGGYEDWLRQRSRAQAESARLAKPAKSAQSQSSQSAQSSPSGVNGRDKTAPPAAAKGGDQDALRRDKLSFKEQRELEALPARIESLETELESLQARMGEGAFYQQSGTVIAQARERLADLEAELVHAYARWELLEARRG
ncbi:MAG TPA: hypothetical protein PLY96_06445, partial [Chromatiaceae bacterium]|nr:hypothetical protein [Chromatiaceae bacterium]